MVHLKSLRIDIYTSVILVLKTIKFCVARSFVIMDLVLLCVHFAIKTVITGNCLIPVPVPKLLIFLITS